MTYTDKNNKTVVLTPVKGEYLVKFKEGFEGEKLIKNLSKVERFKHAKWVPKDFLSIVTFEEEAEKTNALQNTLDELKADDMVEAVIPVFRDDEGFKRLVVPNRLLVAYNPGLKEALTDKLTGKYKIVEQSRFGNWFIIELPADIELATALKSIGNLPETQYCEPVYYGVNDAEEISAGALKWNLNSININDAWAITKGISEIVVAVIDGKPDISHPALKPVFRENLSEEWNFSDNQALSSHSTQILSILAGQSDNLKGISPGARIMPLVVNLDAQYYHQRADAIHYLKNIMEGGSLNGRPVKKIIANCSWKTAGNIGVIREAIQEAASSGVIFVTSAGNESTSGPHYPSDYSKTIKGVFSVAALAPSGQKADYSNYSSAVTVSAPGGAGLPLDEDDIYCADLNNSNSYTAGTSFAAPHLAGVIALMLSVNSSMDAESILNNLVKTAEPIRQQNPDIWQFLGAGRLNAGKALVETNSNHGTITEPTNTEIPVNAQEPSGQTATSVPSHQGGPTIAISIGGDTPTGIDTGIFVKQICDRISMEIENMSRWWVPGSNIKITINSGGSSVVLNYTL